MIFTAHCDKCRGTYKTDEESEMHLGGRCGKCRIEMEKNAKKVDEMVKQMPRHSGQRIPNPLEGYYRPELARDKKTFY